MSLEVAGFLGAAAAASAILARRRRRAAATPPPPLPGGLLPTDLPHVAAVQAMVAELTPPIHSGFLVAAVIVYTNAAGQTRVVTGCNNETAVIQSAICAERTALCQLRLRPDGCSHIDNVYICVNMDDALITPGLLCREFMQEYCSPSTRIVMATHDWVLGVRGRVQAVSLAELYPLPCLYHRVPRARVATVAADFAAKLATPFRPSSVDARGLPPPLPGSPLAAAVAAAAKGGDANAALHVVESFIQDLYAKTRATAASGGDAGSAAFASSASLYPVVYAAGVLMDSGEVHVAATDYGLEYGTTLDACQKLAALIGAPPVKSSSSSGPLGSPAAPPPAPRPQPLVLLYVDSYGNCHAPPATARAWWTEYNHGSVVTYVHARSGELRRVTLAQLAPSLPAIDLDMEDGVKHTTTIKSCC